MMALGVALSATSAAPSVAKATPVVNVTFTRDRSGPFGDCVAWTGVCPVNGDASGSYDPMGGSVSIAWNYDSPGVIGDFTVDATGSTMSHSYAPGIYAPVARVTGVSGTAYNGEVFRVISTSDLPAPIQLKAPASLPLPSFLEVWTTRKQVSVSWRSGKYGGTLEGAGSTLEGGERHHKFRFSQAPLGPVTLTVVGVDGPVSPPNVFTRTVASNGLPAVNSFSALVRQQRQGRKCTVESALSFVNRIKVTFTNSLRIVRRSGKRWRSVKASGNTAQVAEVSYSNAERTTRLSLSKKLVRKLRKAKAKVIARTEVRDSSGRRIFRKTITKRLRCR